MENMKPESIENRWDILYSKYPEVYDEFAKVERVPNLMDFVFEKFDFAGKKILDIGSGSGVSTFQMAKKAEYAIGLEIEDEMRFIAEREAINQNIKNISFVKGTACDIPYRDNYFDIITAVTLPVFIPEEIANYVEETKRVLKRNGNIICVNIAPEWYGGDLAPVILGEERITAVDTEGVVDKILVDNGFKYCDVFSTQEYGSVEKIVRTYGFIFGKNAIEHIKSNGVTKITWKSRIHYFDKN